MANWRNDALSSGRIKESSEDAPVKRKKHKKRFHPCKALECLICTVRYSLEDILDGTYQLETWVCSSCYAEMQRKPHEQSCFGKPTFVMLDGKRELGYDSECRDCKDLCPDRVICQKVVRPDLAV